MKKTILSVFTAILMLVAWKLVKLFVIKKPVSNQETDSNSEGVKMNS
jgi:hypothetical protein